MVDFAELLSEYGYCMHNINKKRLNSIGNMILYHKNIFCIEKQIEKSCSVHAILSHLETNFKLYMINVHLKAGLTSGENERLNQLRSCMKEIEKNEKELKLDFICINGDFNDDLEYSGLLYNLLIDSKYCINVSFPSCTFKDGSVLSFDHAITKHADVKYIKPPNIQKNPEIPNNRIASDHFPIYYELSYQF